MQWLARVCVKRPIIASVIVLLVLVVGAACYLNLGVDRFPKVELPTVIVRTAVPGAGARDVESEVTGKIEEAVNSIAGIEELRSMSTEGLSLVRVTFVLEKDVDVAAQEVRDQVTSIVNQLPLGTQQPVVQ